MNFTLIWATLHQTQSLNSVLLYYYYYYYFIPTLQLMASKTDKLAGTRYAPQ